MRLIWEEEVRDKKKQKILFVNMKAKGHLKDRCVDGRIILNYILNKHALKLRIGFI